MNTRRGPWLSGLIVALLGAVWMIGQVLGGVVSLMSGLLSVDSTDTTLSAPHHDTAAVTPLDNGLVIYAP
jgi:hypothetical protein